MKTIGLLGGMSWESTVTYYRVINEGVKHSLGNLHSAKIVRVSIDFDSIDKLQNKGDWQAVAEILCSAAKSVESAGADFLLICSNTSHKVASEIENSISIPLLHIADTTAKILVDNGVRKVGLLGTAFTMEQDFYKGRLRDKYGLSVLIPNEEDRCLVHDVIYNELCLGKIDLGSKAEFLRIISDLSEQGAETIILGCTEIGLLVNQKDTVATLIDTTQIHAQKAVEYATTITDCCRPEMN